MTGTDSARIAALIWCPFPDQENAAEVVNTLLDEGLVACANMMTNMVSLFEWDGERDKARETGVLLKTNATKLEPAIERLAQLHPYDEPAIVGWRCDAAAPGTAAWLGALGQ